MPKIRLYDGDDPQDSKIVEVTELQLAFIIMVEMRYSSWFHAQNDSIDDKEFPELHKRIVEYDDMFGELSKLDGTDYEYTVKWTI